MFQSWTDCFFTVTDGLRLHFRDYPGPGDSRPLLCLHGLTRNARDFADFADRHAGRFRVIVLEFRGRGESEYDPLPLRYAPPTYVGDVLQLLDHLQIAEAIFVGTSLGGLVTMGIAAVAPQRIAAAILNDVGPEIGEAGIERIQTYLGRDVRFSDWDEAARELAKNQGPSFPNYRHEDWVAMAHRNCRERNGEIVFDYDMGIVEPFRTGGPLPRADIWPLFHALAQKPLLVIRGEISQLLTLDTFEAMRSAVPQGMFVTVPGVGHAPDLDEPAAVGTIDEFLARVEPPY